MLPRWQSDYATLSNLRKISKGNSMYRVYYSYGIIMYKRYSYIQQLWKFQFKFQWNKIPQVLTALKLRRRDHSEAPRKSTNIILHKCKEGRRQGLCAGWGVVWYYPRTCKKQMLFNNSITKPNTSWISKLYSKEVWQS